MSALIIRTYASDMAFKQLLVREGRRGNRGVLAFLLPSCVDHTASCSSCCLVVLLSCLLGLINIAIVILVPAVLA